MPGDPQTQPEILADPLVGEEIGGTYLIVRKIGEGGMGSVYEAKHVRLPKRFAIKVMLPEVAADRVSFERFRREAETTSSLGNIHIAEVTDFNTLPDGSPYMVMEFLEGQDLADVLEATPRLEPARVADLITDLASALSSAHAKNILHRDIKPANVFLTRPEGADGEVVKLLDFGASKSRAPQSASLTAVGMVVGTPWYMSPEQARGEELDARSDQFSLAVVAYQALSGRLPFEADQPMQVLSRIVDERPVPIRTHHPGLSAEVEETLDRALARAREDRFQTFTEFAASLKDALRRAVPAAPITDKAIPRMPGRRSWLGWSAGGAVLVGVILGGIAWLSSRQEAARPGVQMPTGTASSPPAAPPHSPSGSAATIEKKAPPTPSAGRPESASGNAVTVRTRSAPPPSGAAPVAAPHPSAVKDEADLVFCSTPVACIEACEQQRQAKGCLTMAEIYSAGTSSFPADPERAAEYLRKACELGETSACHRPGRAGARAARSDNDSGSCLAACQGAQRQCLAAFRTQFMSCKTGCTTTYSSAVDCRRSCADDRDNARSKCESSDGECRARCGR